MIEEYLSKELGQLNRLFETRFKDYGTSWKDRSINWLIKRLVGEVRELILAEEFGYRYALLHESLDCVLTALLVVERVNNAEYIDSVGRIKTKDEGEE